MTDVTAPLPHDARRASESGLGAAVKWGLLAIFLASSLLFAFNEDEIYSKICPAFNALTFCAFSLLHCSSRYGWKSTLFFLAAAWLISCGLEISSVHNGFPFGLYSYVNAPPPIVLGVPIATGAVYFGMAYVSWMLASLLLGQRTRIAGAWTLIVPVFATFIMVMWDYVLDPVYSTLFSVWVWPQGGSYFGVPLSNYAGWMLVAYIIFQVFALHIARTDPPEGGLARTQHSLFWYELIAAYALQGFLFVLFALGRSGHAEIYRSMALAFVYSMLFVVLLSAAIVWRDRAKSG